MSTGISRSVLVIDGANVIGSRPDGWWRDRAGAARRLHERLAVADTGYDEVVLVLEGEARAGVLAGADGPLTTVHAAGSGDDAIVREARRACERGARVAVVTADRILAGRAEHAGAVVLGPSWLLAELGG